MPKFVASFGVAAFTVAGYAMLSWVDSRVGESVYISPRLATERSATTTAPSPIASTSVSVFRVTHLPPPSPLKAIYMTSCVASDRKWRSEIAGFIDKTELNAVVIDIKDYTGTVSFDVGDERYPKSTNGCFVSDMKEFISSLHEKNIYVIGRVQVFQDGTYTKLHPELAVKRKDGTVWKDYKGISFIDVGATQYWEHVVRLSDLSYAAGFDEINFDYIRYPSDGDMKNIWFSHSGSSTKQDMLERFFSYLRKKTPPGAPVISVDLFGMTTTNTDDLNIGQVLERTLPHFDYIAPMVYPSHYPTMFNGWKNPNNVPGEVVKFSMEAAVRRANELEKKEAVDKGLYPRNPGTTTPAFVPTGKYADKLRPWIQDFDYGGDYDEADVRAQKKAVYDSGLSSWMVWDPANRYTRSAFDIE